MRKKRLWITSFAIILLLSFYVPSYGENEGESHNILIINSYHQGFQWTDDQTSGFLATIGSTDANLSVEYLDWKRFPSKQNLDYIYMSMKLKYDNQQIDLIYCTDDAAFDFALQYREDIFSNAPIVFSGVNVDSVNKLASGEVNYTGVIEEISPEKTIQTALDINPKIDTIYLIHDNTESALSTAALCTQIVESNFPDLSVVSLNQISSYEVIDTVSEVEKNSMVLVTSYFTDLDGTSIDHQKFCKSLADVSPVPVYHIYDFGMGQGIFGGNLVLGTVQGEEAARLAIKVLRGEDIASIPLVNKDIKKFVFDYQVVNRYDIPQSKIPDQSMIINEPFSFIKTYRTLVLIVLSAFIFLVLFILFLVYHLRKVRIMRQELMDSHEELTGLYEELAASEEELRNQYGEIAASKERLEEYSSKLLFQSHHNDLTGLFNRHYLYEVVNHEFNSTSHSAFLYMNLDNFSFINDVIGHSDGDILLQQIGSRLSSLRNQDIELIHLSGDEFVFFMKDAESKQVVEVFIEKIIESFSFPFSVENHNFTVRVSIGISLCPLNGTDINTLVSNANLAMNRVKNTGKNGFYFFDEVLRDELMMRVNTENSFQKALDHNEFVLHYQPQINQVTNEIEGFEALVRWKSSEFGFMSPDQFIPIAEENGFITILGEWVLITACAFIRDLNKRMNKEYHVSVNISVIQIISDEFMDIIKNALSFTGLSPELLELEITESTIMKSTDIVIEKIERLRELGIDIALDDFGTGYSSLSYLRNIPLSTIKIDKTFMKEIPKSDDNTKIIEIIMELGQKFNLRVVAEGVELPEQLHFLRGIGCEMIQGYIYSRPLPENEIDPLISIFTAKKREITE